jgi:hypothetical protein
LLKERSDASGVERYFLGVFSFHTSAVRRCGSGPRVMAVFDTAAPKRPHHSEIMAVPTSRLPGLERERLKRSLVAAAGNNFAGPREFRKGLLSAFVKQA